MSSKSGSGSARGGASGGGRVAPPKPLTPAEQMERGITPDFKTRQEASAWLKEATGAKVTFPASMSKDDIARVSWEIADARRQTDGKGWDQINMRAANVNEVQAMGRASAWYDRSRRQILFRTTEIDSSSQADWSRAVASGWTSSPSVFQHELGHALHERQAVRTYNKIPNDKTFSTYQWTQSARTVTKSDTLNLYAKDIASRVSRYGSTNPFEFVAEVFAGQLYGRKYDKQVMALYDAYKGPKVTPRQ